MKMSRTALTQNFIKFQQDEERMVLSATKAADMEMVMEIYNKTKITPDDMLREYTPAEVRELCERTKVRVKMNKLNSVYDTKKRFDQKRRLENKSPSWVNRMFVKAASSRMVEPYTELEMAKYKELAACHTKKDNNVRLDRWHRQRARASQSNDLQINSVRSTESLSETAQPEPEERPEQPECPSPLPNMPLLHVELSPGAFEFQDAV